MALTDTKDLPRFSLLRAPAWLQRLLSSEHALTQRMAGVSFGIRVVSALVVFLSQIVLARWMGSFEFGVYVYVWTWLLLLGDLVHLGLPMVAQSFIPKYTQRNTLSLLRGFLSGSRWLVFGISTAAAAIGAAIVYALETALDQHLIMPFYLACVALPFMVMASMCDGIARSYNWIWIALAPHSLLRPLLLIALIALIYAVGVPVNAVTTMAALVVAVWLAALLQFALLHRQLHNVVAPGARRYELREWFSASLPIIAVWGFYTLLTCTDVLVLQHFRPSDEIAHYYAAGKTLSFVTFVYYSVASSAAHRYSAYHAAGDHDGLAAIVASSVRWIFWPSLAATLVVLALGRPVLMLFGPNFDHAYPVMLILAVGLMARAAVGPAERVLTMTGHQRVCMRAYAIAFAVNLALCLVLAGPFGGLGVATATSVAFIVESILLAVLVKRRLKLTMFVWWPR